MCCQPSFADDRKELLKQARLFTKKAINIARNGPDPSNLAPRVEKQKKVQLSV